MLLRARAGRATGGAFSRATSHATPISADASSGRARPLADVPDDNLAALPQATFRPIRRHFEHATTT